MLTPNFALPSQKDIKQLCTVQYGIDRSTLRLERSYRDPATNKKWRDATFDLVIMLDSATLRFMVNYKGERVAYTSAKYKEDF